MISILIPIYNGIEFIDESVSSVLSQTMVDWELIIAVNGHPTNSSVYQTAKRYQDMYPSKIRVFDFFDISGKSNTLNAMLPYCAFEFVAILDVDDIWDPRKLEIQLPFLLGGFDVVGSDCCYFGDRDDNRSGIPLGDVSTLNFLKGNPVINSSAIVRKDLCFWRLPGPLEDFELWLRLRVQKKRFYNCHDVLVKHRIYADSFFNTKNSGALYREIVAEYSSLLG